MLDVAAAARIDVGQWRKRGTGDGGDKEEVDEFEEEEEDTTIVEVGESKLRI